MNEEADRVRWDVIEEHLEEAAFLWTQWETALDAPDFTLSEVADTIEARLLAHLDALEIGGPAVARRLLEPALRDPDPTLSFPAAFTLLLSQDTSHVQTVV